MIQSYPWYIADWRESETRISLTLEERGLYRELLDYCYLEGSLPVDENSLGRLSACTVREIKRSLPKVIALFVREGDRLYHNKVNEVSAKLADYHKQKAHAGIASGQARRQRSLNGRSNEIPTDVEPSPTPAPTPTPPPAPEAAVGAAAERMYERHPKKRDLPLLPEALENSTRVMPLSEIEACHELWCKTEDWTKNNGRYCPSLPQWLIDRGYLQKPDSGQPRKLNLYTGPCEEVEGGL